MYLHDSGGPYISENDLNSTTDWILLFFHQKKKKSNLAQGEKWQNRRENNLVAETQIFAVSTTKNTMKMPHF